MQTTRRRALQLMATLPLVKLLPGRFPFSEGVNVQSLATEGITSGKARDIARLIMTAEFSHKAKVGGFGSARELFEAGFVGTARFEQKRGLKLTPNSAEIVPGWRLRIDLSPDKKAFLMSLQTKRLDVEYPIVAACEDGIIRHARKADLRFPHSYVPIDQIAGLEPLEKKRPQGVLGKLESALTRVGLFTVALAYDPYCCSGNCGPPHCYCCILGYGSCPACCYENCGQCAMCCDITCCCPC